MKHLFGKILLSCGLVLVLGSYGFGDSESCSNLSDGTRKINKAKFFSSLANVLDKVGQATVASSKTKEEDQKQKIEAVAAILNFVGVVSGDQTESVNPGVKDTVNKKQTRSCGMVVSSDLLEAVFCALRVSLEANIDVIADSVRSSLSMAQMVQNNVFLTRGVVDSTVTVQNTSKDSTKMIVALVTVLWKLVQEVMTQENISEYLSKQVTEIINYVYGHLVADITQDAQEIVDQMPADSAVAMQGAFVGNIVASLVTVNSEK